MAECPSCGAIVSESDMRCSQCGARLDNKKSNSSKLIIGIIAVVAILAIVGVLASGAFTGADSSDASKDSSQAVAPVIENNSTTDNTQSESSSSDDSSSSSGTEYWASAKTGKFHLPSCEWAQKIKDSNKVVFNSRDEAIASGREPCSVCNP